MIGILRRGACIAFGMTLVACTSTPGGNPGTTSTPSTTPGASASAAAQTSPTPTADAVVQAWPPPPNCPGAAAADVCSVNIPAGGSGGSFQASSSERILFRVGWSDPTQQSCNEFAANASLGISIDGASAAIAIVPCQFVAVQFNGCPNQWRYDGRFLSPPLAAGNHTVVGTYRFNGPVTGATTCTGSQTETTPAGTVQTFSKTISVS